MELTYNTNELGDIYEAVSTGRRTPIDPADWGWAKIGGRHDQHRRRSIAGVRTLPGFVVTEEQIDRIVPGPRTDKTKWDRFVDGGAPPAAVQSKNGENGTRGYFNRLSEAVGHAADALVRDPERSPFLVHDFVGGRLFRVHYERPTPAADGMGTVYVLEDGFGIKVGYTNGDVAKRVSQLQTGNSRSITTLAEIGQAPPDLEAQLHAALEEWNISGEWFAREPLITMIADAGGVEAWLHSLAGSTDFPVVVHPPYA